MQSMKTSEFGDRRDPVPRWRPKLASDVAVELGRLCALKFVPDMGGGREHRTAPNV